VESKKINLNKYKLSNDKFINLLDNLDTKVPEGYITIEGNNASREKESSVKNSK